jgi:8-oxo-dGTP pyrophosphatase MutT (NUDIX family)/phosphohistidine phosphatase SixA
VSGESRPRSARATPAAGGVVWAGASDRPLVALVHRPRYDDWTLPKGKLESGEHPLLAAVREVGEETGARVRLGRRLKGVEYPLGDSVKRVHYWAMRYLDGEHKPSREVDAIRWLPIEEASQQLSYDVDRDVLADFASYPADTTTVLLMRHAKAGKRSNFAGPDAQRPLDKIGRRQARDAVDLLSCFAPTLVFAADRLRCEQTVLPLALALELEVVSAPAFSDEACAHDPKPATTALRWLLSRDQASVISSQGLAIPLLLDAIGVPRGRHSQRQPSRKGSVWALTWARPRKGLPGSLNQPPLIADYYPHPA